MPDRIEETLAALRTDIDRLPVADSGSVRRRGQQRTRNQVLGSALATVAVVAAAVGVGGGLLGDERTSAPPATDPPTATTSSPEPTVVDPPLTLVPPAVVLESEDVGLTTVAQQFARSGIETLTGGCLLGSDDLVEFGFRSFGPTSEGPELLAQSVITQRQAENAQRQLAGFRSDFEACEERRAQVPGAPETTVVPAELTPAEQGRLTALGEDAWAFQVTTPEFTSLVVGFRVRNASSVLSADSSEFTADRVLELGGNLHAAMVGVYVNPRQS